MSSSRSLSTSPLTASAGIAFRAASSCAGPSCVIQGNQFIGNTISGGPASIPASAIGMFYGGSFSSTPAWDSNQWNIGTVSPPASNTRYAVVRAEPLSNRAVIKCAAVGLRGVGGIVATPASARPVEPATRLSCGRRL